MIKLLLVEDDVNLSYIVQAGLQEIIGGYEVIVAEMAKKVLRNGKNSSLILSFQILICP